MVIKHPLVPNHSKQEMYIATRHRKACPKTRDCTTIADNNKNLTNNVSTSGMPKKSLLKYLFEEGHVTVQRETINKITIEGLQQSHFLLLLFIPSLFFPEASVIRLIDEII
jgi:hypothetical protein